MTGRDMRELFQCLEAIYRLHPETAQALLKRILDELHGEDEKRGK